MSSFEHQTTARLPDGAALGRWWKPIESDRIECELCPRRCHLKDGDRGFCFVRENRVGRMALSTYGRSTGFCIDPIEKKPLNHFFPGTSVLSFGTAGCNLGCKFCQNWDISKSRDVARLSTRAEPDSIAEAAVQNGCRSVAFTYNDPVIWAEYAIDTARVCRDRGIYSVAVTAGYICDAPRASFFDVMDAANVDLKAFTEEFYEKITYSHLQPVLDTIRYIKEETSVWLELTNLVIPNANDSSGELRKMCDWIMEAVGDSVPIHFTAFHPDFRMQDRPRTDPDTLNRAFAIAREAGVRYPYVGNTHDVQRQSTYCTGCGCRLIERDWYVLGDYQIHVEPRVDAQPFGVAGVGRCTACNAVVPGRFEAVPGSWGNRRLPIKIENYQAPEEQDVLPSEQGDPRKEFGMSTDMNSNTGSTPTSPASIASPLKIEALSESQRSAIARAAAACTIQAVTGQPAKASGDLIGDLSQRVVMGVFVTLKRGEILRACCGVLGQPMPLLGAITSASIRTAKEDNRFAPISPSELPYLDLDVTLLGPFKTITAKGAARMDAVEVGKHGLMIQRGQKSGLLLPSVAVERGWDAYRFLQAVCAKAGLRDTAWESDEATVRTFHGESMGGPLADYLSDSTPKQIAEPIDARQLAAYAQLAGQNIVAMSTGGTPSYVVPQLDDMTVNAIVLSMQWSRQAEQAEARQGNALQVSFRPGVPLQSTLFQMCQKAALMFQQERFIGQLQIGLSLGFDPALHGWGRNAHLEGIDTTTRGLVISDQSHCGFAFDPSRSAEELLQILRRSLPISSRDAIVHSLYVKSTMPHVISISGPTPIHGKGIRPPAVAGKFYPAEDAARRAMVRDLLSSQSAQHSVRAIMVPHAGLKYSGKVAAKVWQSVADLEKRTVVVISPKHTRNGVNWSVCPFDKWLVSKTFSLEADKELAAQLVEKVDALQFDAGAHRDEHGIEVQLPILEQVAPGTKVVGLALHGGSWEDIKEAASQLAGAIRDLPDQPLLVISSDMNHYASEAENHRRDRLALDALAAGDPEQLLETCKQNEISMCGVVPAALVLQTLIELGQRPEVTEVAYATSGDVNGDKTQVVGYAGALIG